MGLVAYLCSPGATEVMLSQTRGLRQRMQAIDGK
jgi:hypothetical protein